jgi:hypothetical protein
MEHGPSSVKSRQRAFVTQSVAAPYLSALTELAAVLSGVEDYTPASISFGGEPNFAFSSSNGPKSVCF